MRTFDNGIVWWTQERFQGDEYAAHVVMICKHVRRTFRWHCLEVLPLWRWSGDGAGAEPPPPDPLPTTDAEWEAEVRGQREGERAREGQVQKRTNRVCIL